MGKSDIEIARDAKLQPVQAIGEALGLKETDLELHGYKAKISILTMPGLPKKPAAESIDIDQDGNVVGLF